MITPELQARWAADLLPNYGTPAVALVRGKGAEVWDADGRRYLDLLAGIAVNCLGHAHPAILAAVSTQLATLGHTSNLYITEPVLDVAEKLLGYFGKPAGKAFFCNSGAEAMEAACKLARRSGRPKIIAARGAFHGRTMGALALTGQPGKKTAFEPLIPGVDHVPFGDVDALAEAVDAGTAAVVLEPILGEAGVIMPPGDYLRRAREITERQGALLILDEIQTGVGRTGEFFTHTAAGIAPDAVALAKGLAGGLPIGALLVRGPAAEWLSPGSHGTTFGGNPVCAAAANAVLQTIEQDDVLDNVRTVGARLREGIGGLGHRLVRQVDGAGLLLGIVLAEPLAAACQEAAVRAGYLVNAAAPDRIRLAPPLILSESQADAFLADLPAILDQACQKGSGA